MNYIVCDQASERIALVTANTIIDAAQKFINVCKVTGYIVDSEDILIYPVTQVNTLLDLVYLPDELLKDDNEC